MMQAPVCLIQLLPRWPYMQAAVGSDRCPLLLAGGTKQGCLVLTS
jgi:hypothetical protein